MPRILILIPTYEPDYIHHPELEEFYIQNFDSFLHAEGNFDIQLAITDFASSRSFKAFLKRYVDGRNSCFLVDGDHQASLHVAINVTLANFEYDYLAYAACDLRTRDAQWLQRLLGDFEDPKVQITSATVTINGHELCEQNQPAPLDRESRTIDPCEVFNLHCTVFSKTFLMEFDNRYPDIFDCGYTEYCLMYQLAALEYISKINFRVNLIHERMESVRFRPGRGESGWRTRNNLYQADFQKFLTRGPILMHPAHTSVKEVGLIHKIRILVMLFRAYGWRFFYFRLCSRRALDNFCQLDVTTKVSLLKTLFYRPISDYEQYTYSIYGPGSAAAGPPLAGAEVTGALASNSASGT